MFRLFGRLIGVLLLVCLLTGVCAAEQVVDPDYAFQYFIELLQAENYQKALDMYQDIQQSYDYSTAIPEFPVYEIYAQGLLALKNGDLDTALEQLEKAQKIGKTSEDIDFPDMEGLTPCGVVIAYVNGRIAMRDQDSKAALEYFEDSKNYKDTNNLIIEIYNYWIDPPYRYTLGGVDLTDTSAEITWADTEAAEKYTVCYQMNRKQQETVQADGCSVTLENLLPGTEYEVSIIAEGDTGKPLVFRFETKQARELSGPVRTGGNGYLRYYEAKNADRYDYQTMLNRGMIRTAETMKSSEGSDTGLTYVEVKKGFETGKYVYEYFTTISNTDEAVKSFRWTLVLRMAREASGSEEDAAEDPGFDVYCLNGTSNASAADASIDTLYRFDKLPELLSMHFQAYGNVWVEGPGIIELYIDGMFAGSIGIGIVAQ